MSFPLEIGVGGDDPACRDRPGGFRRLARWRERMPADKAWGCKRGCGRRGRRGYMLRASI